VFCTGTDVQVMDQSCQETVSCPDLCKALFVLLLGGVSEPARSTTSILPGAFVDRKAAAIVYGQGHTPTSELQGQSCARRPEKQSAQQIRDNNLKTQATRTVEDMDFTRSRCQIRNSLGSLLSSC
jgi:hypothetical protein